MTLGQSCWKLFVAMGSVVIGIAKNVGAIFQVAERNTSHRYFPTCRDGVRLPFRALVTLVEHCNRHRCHVPESEIPSGSEVVVRIPAVWSFGGFFQTQTILGYPESLAKPCTRNPSWVCLLGEALVLGVVNPKQTGPACSEFVDLRADLTAFGWGGNHFGTNPATETSRNPM